MKKLNISEMHEIKASGNITGTLLNSIIRGANVFTDVGRYFGSSIRRFVNKNLCRF